MTPRQTKRRPSKRTAVTTTRLAWEDHHRQFFQMADMDWTPPAEVAVRHGVRSWTMIAIFVLPTGKAVTLTTRLLKTASGVILGDQSMKLAFTVRGSK